MSTTSIKQGVQYEITADDKASQVAQKAADNVARSTEDTGRAAENAAKKHKKHSDEAVSGFNAMRLASSAMRGDFVGMSQELAKLFSKSSKSAADMIKHIGAIGAAISATIEFASSLKTALDHAFNLNIDKSFSKASSQLADLKSKAAEFAAALSDANAAAQKQTSHLAAQIDASNRLAKALSDVARQKELANAASDDERAAINARYDLANAATDESSRDKKLALQRQALEDEEQRLIDQKFASARRERSARKLEGEMFSAGYLDKATEARNQFGAEVELQASLDEQIEDVRRKQELLLLEERAQAAEDTARHIKEDADAAAAQDAAFERRFAADFQRLQSIYGDDWRDVPNLSVGEDAVRSLALQREYDRELADFSELDSISQNTAYLRQIYSLLAQE